MLRAVCICICVEQSILHVLSTVRVAGREYWQYMVAHATGTADQRVFEEVYAHYSAAHNWKVNPGLMPFMTKAKASGVKRCLCGVAV